jgi:hypothetical protein
VANAKMQHCFWCGAELGVYESYPGDVEACGNAVCQREMRAEYRAMEDEKRERAAEDNYDRYR